MKITHLIFLVITVFGSAPICYTVYIFENGTQKNITLIFTIPNTLKTQKKTLNPGGTVLKPKNSFAFFTINGIRPEYQGSFPEASYIIKQTSKEIFELEKKEE